MALKIVKASDPPTDEETKRFLSRVLVGLDNGCAEWIGPLSPSGYGVFPYRGKTLRAHRFAFSLFQPLPELSLDHLCRNRKCVNPEHLEPVTDRENLMRSPIAPARLNADKVVCRQGHPLSEANTHLTNGRRVCRECARAKALRHYRNHRAEINARRSVTL